MNLPTFIELTVFITTGVQIVYKYIDYAGKTYLLCVYIYIYIYIYIANSTRTQFIIPVFSFFFESVKRRRTSYVFWNKIQYLRCPVCNSFGSILRKAFLVCKFPSFSKNLSFWMTYPFNKFIYFFGEISKIFWCIIFHLTILR